MSVANTTTIDADANNTNKKVIFKNCYPFTVTFTSMYDLIECSDTYAERSGSL